MKGRPFALGQGDAVLEIVVEQRAIGKSGQRIIVGNLLQLALALAQLVAALFQLRRAFIDEGLQLSLPLPQVEGSRLDEQ